MHFHVNAYSQPDHEILVFLRISLYMDQFPQDGENGQNVAFFHNFWSSAVTKPDEIAPFFQLSVVYHMFLMPKTLWLDLWGHFKVS